MAEQVELALKGGRVAGVREAGLYRFSGIPFAEAPIGRLRFQPPEPRKPWAGVLDATAPSPIAPQTAPRLVSVMGDFQSVQSEDCLRVTISTPGLDAAGRPVIVWLHGGGFSSGSGGLAWYDGGRLAVEGDVVVVGVNYRLGALGFLVADGLSAGNLGLLDQALALRFIRDNIAAFGGDPDHLTLMGQSAGGNSIAALFATGQDLTGVRRAIFQSPALGLMPEGRVQARATGAEFLKRVGALPENGNPREIAQAVPVDHILAAQAGIARAHARYGDTAPPFQLSVGELLPAGLPLQQRAAATMQGIEVLIGVTADEMLAFFAKDARTAMLDAAAARYHAAEVFGEHAVDLFDRLRSCEPHADPGRLFSRLAALEVMEGPAIELADRLAANGGDVYFYRFDWQPEGSVFGSCHCLELPFVFGMSEAWRHSPMLAGADAGSVARLSGMMRAAWISFVRTGRPSAPGLPEWKRWTQGSRQAMRLDEASGMGVLDGAPS